MLVIEDYHVITSPEVHEAVTFLLDHAPAGLELVLTTRVEPALPIARLRARGELLEIATSPARVLHRRGGDLAQRAAGPRPRPRSTCPGSWSGPRAGPRASIWRLCPCAAEPTPHEFIEAFAGDERNVVDYLTTEVLSGLSAEVYDFLLSTSVLERLCPSLCDEVTGRRAAPRGC